MIKKGARGAFFVDKSVRFVYSKDTEREDHMLTLRQIAQRVSETTPRDADRYDQIYAIKQELLLADYRSLATDRETIDSILDILFDEYSYRG